MARNDVPDEVPVADALEQQRDSAEQKPDEEAAVSDPDEPPLEATEGDWQEQREAVTEDVDLDEIGREEE